MSGAHFYAKAEREVYTQLPSEDPRSHEKDVCGRLLRTMYGTLDAADRWAEHYSAILVASGFQRGKASPCQFYHEAWGVRLMVHGDDFVIVAQQAGRDKTMALLQKHFELKYSTAGPKEGMPKELRVLGRIAVCHQWGWSLEADPCLLESACEKLGLTEAKGTATPGHNADALGSGIEVKARRQDPRPVSDPEAAWPGFDESPR